MNRAHKPNPRRAELRALSALIRPLVKAGAFESVNHGLIAHYSEEVGCTTSDWHTFADWRKAGRAVNKGERGFPIWGQPRRMAMPEGARMSDLQVVAAMQGAEPEGPEFYPVAYLFHVGQVAAEQPKQRAA